MRLYLIVVAALWAVLFGAFVYAYSEMWDSPWLSHANFMAIMAIATSGMFGCMAGLAEIFAAFDALPRWVRAGLGALASGFGFAAIAFILGTRESSAYEWPGLSGFAIVLFREYRMLAFATIPLPVACFICAALVYRRSAAERAGRSR